MQPSYYMFSLLWIGGDLSSSFYSSPTFRDTTATCRPTRVFSLGEGTLGRYAFKPIKGAMISRDIGSQAGHSIQFFFFLNFAKIVYFFKYQPSKSFNSFSSFSFF